MTCLFPPLAPAIRRDLEEALERIDCIVPLPRRFRARLPRDIAELSRLLTANRGERTASYLGKPPLLSAYLRYFLPWNLYRLCRLLPTLPLTLASGDRLIDLGSGPLTFPLGLWISRPDLRGAELEFRCIDHNGSVLEAGKRLFYGIAGESASWRINTIRASLDAPVRGPKAALVSALNVFNELFWDTPHRDAAACAASAGKSARLLARLTAETGSLFIVEPGIPRSGAFIAALRRALFTYGQCPYLPCPHTESCPFPGGRNAKWCHFAVSSHDAPEALLRLSESAGLPKERATLSFLLTGSSEPGESRKTPLPVRIISDPFRLSNRRGPQSGDGLYGRYGCSGKGLILVTGPGKDIEKRESGSLLLFAPCVPERRDFKSGGIIQPIDQEI